MAFFSPLDSRAPSITQKLPTGTAGDPPSSKEGSKVQASPDDTTEKITKGEESPLQAQELWARAGQPCSGIQEQQTDDPCLAL